MKLLILAGFVGSFGFGQSSDCDTLDKCQEALKANPRSCLAHFRMGEIYLSQHDYMRAGNELRESLQRPDRRWIEALAHIDLGKSFDATHQRERALNEYRLALRTKDNTRGALDAAKKYIETPYSPD